MESSPDDDTGGNENGDTDNSFLDGAFGTLWDWLSGIADGITSVAEGVLQIPVKIGESLTEVKDKLHSVLNSIWNRIGLIPEQISIKLKDIFVPDTVEIENIIESTVESISAQLGVQFNTLERLFEMEMAPSDVEDEISIPNVGSFEVKLLDTKYLIEGVALMRPYIRGFFVLLLMLFIWRQAMTFIGQDPSIAHHAHENYEAATKPKRHIGFYDE